MRLIYADDVKKEIDDWLDVVGDVVIGKHLSYYGELLGCIEDAPTVEAVPVVRGEWKQQTDFDEDNNAIFECSNCMHGDVQAKGAEVPYCWFCGADMRGEKK